ncbi:subtilisin-like protease-like protein [Corchorus olitorius]|uniref:Subtilisin-like protease-like protein n=1 Tax=Corchorus olitorius TaxID=93759 RepID=A0A1R3GQ31_9ROSI|nr:subtilisin-like protease-like protein [Corchorus olitorius]
MAFGRPKRRPVKYFQTLMLLVREPLLKLNTASVTIVLLVPNQEVNRYVFSAGVDTEIGNNKTHPPIMNADSSMRISSSRNPKC